MGRPMRPIGNPRAGVGRLAVVLRQGRRRRGVTRRELAEHAGCSVSAVQRAESGEARPGLPVVLSIASACGLDLPRVEALWKDSRHERGSTGVTEAPPPALIRTPADMAAALRRVWQENGEPSIREMECRAETRAKEFAPLSRSAANRIRRRLQQPTSIGQLSAYLIACGVADQALPAWRQAWLRARDAETSVQLPTQRPAAETAPLTRGLRDAEAAALMDRAGLTPLDPFPGPRKPWTAVCGRCGQISRFTLVGLTNGRGCLVCAHRSIA